MEIEISPAESRRQTGIIKTARDFYLKPGLNHLHMAVLHRRTLQARQPVIARPAGPWQSSRSAARQSLDYHAASAARNDRAVHSGLLLPPFFGKLTNPAFCLPAGLPALWLLP